MLSYLCLVRIILLLLMSITSHLENSNTTLHILSHSWLVLKKFCLSPLTGNMFSIEIEEFLLILPILMIFPLPLSPKVTNPPSFGLRDVNWVSSPVMCLEHPLSKYQWFLFDLAWKHTYKIVHFTLGTQTILDHWGLILNGLLWTHEFLRTLDFA